MSETAIQRPKPLQLEVKELERKWRAGCCTSSTSPRCTCLTRLTMSCTLGAD
jgi:hypothetical protein